MGLDFWSVKLKKDLKKEDFNLKSHWSLIEDNDIDDLLDEETLEFINKKCNDKDLYRLCCDTVDYFVGGEAIYENSESDINTLADKLNEFIGKNPNYEYISNRYGQDEIIYSNKEVKLFINYINIIRDNGFVLWCSW